MTRQRAATVGLLLGVVLTGAQTASATVQLLEHYRPARPVLAATDGAVKCPIGYVCLVAK